MKERMEAKISTDNPHLGIGIEVTVEFTVASDLQECLDFAGGEDALVKMFNVDTIKRRKANAARAELRESKTSQDWEELALKTGEDYIPGRKGRKPQTVSRTEYEDLSKEEILAALEAKGWLK